MCILGVLFLLTWLLEAVRGFGEITELWLSDWPKLRISLLSITLFNFWQVNYLLWTCIFFFLFFLVVLNFLALYLFIVYLVFVSLLLEYSWYTMLCWFQRYEPVSLCTDLAWPCLLYHLGGFNELMHINCQA